jgi:hypothetical protein
MTGLQGAAPLIGRQGGASGAFRAALAGEQDGGAARLGAALRLRSDDTCVPTELGAAASTGKTVPWR